MQISCGSCVIVFNYASTAFLQRREGRNCRFVTIYQRRQVGIAYVGNNRLCVPAEPSRQIEVAIPFLWFEYVKHCLQQNRNVLELLWCFVVHFFKVTYSTASVFVFIQCVFVFVVNGVVVVSFQLEMSESII
jgi:hypothetical protein